MGLTSGVRNHVCSVAAGWGAGPEGLRGHSPDCECVRCLPVAWGNWLSGLDSWDWWLTITFRDTRWEWDYHWHRPIRVPMTDGPLRPPLLSRQGLVSRFGPDPRLDCRQSAHLPTAAEQWRRVRTYLHALEWKGAVTSGRPVSWVAVEEFGRVSGRFHVHALIAGVAYLNREEWFKRALDQFGRTRIEPFDPGKAAAFYAAKYAAKALGELHLGGVLPGCDLNRFEDRRGASGGRIVVAPSDRRPQALYNQTLTRWHR